jgi:NADH-quinone oxidoreductase subunit C
MDNMQAVVDALRARFADAILDVIAFRDETTIVVDKRAIVEVATFCRDADGLVFNFLSDMCGVDYWPEEPRFAINYHLYSMTLGHVLRLKVYVPGDSLVVSTLTGVYPAAGWQEREIWDLLGIQFEGHPDPRRILMPHDWTGHPLRKDYPLGYEEVQFSFNVDEVMANKPHPRE